jgi:hypothetical protein
MPILLNLLNLLGANKKLLIYASAICAVFMGGWHMNGVRWQHRYDARETAWNAASQKATARMEAWRAAKQAEVDSIQKDTLQKVAQIASDNDALQRKITSMKAIRYESKPSGCPEPHIAPVIRLCRNAAWSGTPADAAACQAGGMPSIPTPSLPTTH